MKKNNTNLLLEEKMKTLKVKPNKSFKNKLLNSLEKEYEKGFEKSFHKQKFNFINLDIMKNITKKIIAWLAIAGVALWTIWAFNTSYANEKNNVFDYISAGIEFLMFDLKEWESKQFIDKNGNVGTIEMVSVENALKFNALSKEEQLKQLKKEWSIPSDVTIDDLEFVDEWYIDFSQEEIKELHRDGQSLKGVNVEDIKFMDISDIKK